MRSVDTNIVVRYLVNDDPHQFAIARNIFRSGEVFVATTVLLETEWVLRSAYRYKTDALLDALAAVAGIPGVTIEDPAALTEAIALCREGMDFADALHLAASAGCDTFLTFDRKLVQGAGGRAVLA